AASSISPSGKVAAAGGESKTFTFSANAGYHISSVIVDAVPLTAAQIDQGSYTFTNVYSNHTIEVRSAPGQNTTGIILTISISGGGHAEYSINAAPFERYVSPVNNLPLGANVVIRATADDGYRFDKWETPSAKSTSEVVFDDVTSSLNLKLSFAKEGGDNTILWIVIAIVILVILFLLALFVLRGRRKEDGI
ncbi:MAG: hypothetical protein FWC29_03435, partial [Methanomassiliicoccaceae archaeon]|nr:hypothetical protein [Methanomassiliicoccaceae archaeon]